MRERNQSIDVDQIMNTVKSPSTNQRTTSIHTNASITSANTNKTTTERQNNNKKEGDTSNKITRTKATSNCQTNHYDHNHHLITNLNHTNSLKSKFQQADQEQLNSVKASNNAANLHPNLMSISQNSSQNENQNESSILKLIREKHTHKKSVTFTESSSEIHANSVEDIINIMLCGTHMVKVRSNVRLYDRYFWLDIESNSIHWEPSKKDIPHVHISCIKEIRWGQMTETFQNADPEGTLIGKNDYRRDFVQESKKCFSIIYSQSKPNLITKQPTTLDYSVLDLMVESAELAEIWVLGLTLLQSVKYDKDPIGKLTSNLKTYDTYRSKWLENLYDQKYDEFTIQLEEEILNYKNVNNLENLNILEKYKDENIKNLLSLHVATNLLNDELSFVSLNCARSTLIKESAIQYFQSLENNRQMENNSISTSLSCNSSSNLNKNNIDSTGFIKKRTNMKKDLDLRKNNMKLIQIG